MTLFQLKVPQNPLWYTNTYTGLNVQLSPLFIPLFKELSGHQLRNLDQREESDESSQLYLHNTASKTQKQMC